MFFTGGFPGFGAGGAAQMSADQQQQSKQTAGQTAEQTGGQTGGPTAGPTAGPTEGPPGGPSAGQGGSPLQQQLFRIAAALHSRASQSAKQTAAALLQYCSTGDVRVLLAIQRHLCGIQDGNGDTPLHLAIIHQQTGVIQQLIHTLLSSQQQTILNTANHLQQTPLHLAVITRQVKVVEGLLRAGADPSLLDKDGRSPLHLAALAGDSTTLRPLLAHLGERHAHLVNAADFHGLHPLHLAVRRDGERCLHLLVKGGAKINAPEQKSGNTALHMAVRENLFKVACTLITELKADVNACTFGGNTPLHLAASLGSPTLCSMLIAAGADKNMENDEPLVFSSSSDDDEEEEESEGAGRGAATPPANPRKRPVGGHTPLDLAKCQKVRNLLNSRQSPKSSRHVSKKIKPSSSTEEPESSGMDEDTLSRLVEVLSVGEVPWRRLAEKLGMMTLTHLYQDSPTPCHHLLQHYQLGGGPVDGLIDALQSLGLTEGVRLLRNTERHDDKHNNSDAKVDSGFGSQPMEEEEEPPVANQ